MAEYKTLKDALTAFASKIKKLLEGKQDTLTAGTGITITGSTISSTSGGSGGIQEKTGAELKQLKETGLYLCTSTATPFSAGGLYQYYSKTNTWKAISTTTVEVKDPTPQIMAFTLSGAGGYLEIGSETTLSKYTFGVSAPEKWSSFVIQMGETALAEIAASGDSSYTGNVATSNGINKVKITVPGEEVSIDLIGMLKESGDTDNYKRTITGASYEYFGIRSDSETEETLPKAFTSAEVSNMYKPTLSENVPTSATITHEPKNSTGFAYLWILIPAYKKRSISKIMYGDFELPYKDMGEVDVTNSWGVTSKYKCYRSEECLGQDTMRLKISY